jgi:hypothetical protein
VDDPCQACHSFITIQKAMKINWVQIGEARIVYTRNILQWLHNFLGKLKLLLLLCCLLCDKKSLMFLIFYFVCYVIEVENDFMLQ